MRLHAITMALALGALGGAAGCSDAPTPAAGATTTTAGGTTPAGDPAAEVLATVGGDAITMQDVRAVAGAELDQLETSYHRARSKAIDAALTAVLRDRVLIAEAERQGKTLNDLIVAEAGGSLEPNDIEIAAWYEDNRERVGGRPLDQVRAQIADLLRNQHRQRAMERLEARLNAERGVRVLFEPFRVTFDNAGAPSAGNPAAPVTVVEFSDFQCPFCQRFAPTLRQVARDYGDRVHVVYRQYPITTIHPDAFKAAEASLCANEQGKFWEMHDAMFAQQDRLQVRELKALAGRLGLDRERFDACLDAGRHVEQVQQDLAEGSRAGITGTPAVFVNGVELPGGAVPYETVRQAIDRELAR
jgi:predicted DsbA family dithiol-disulfide isomerase